jgi:hypothetical protein
LDKIPGYDILQSVKIHEEHKIVFANTVQVMNLLEVLFVFLIIIMALEASSSSIPASSTEAFEFRPDPQSESTLKYVFHENGSPATFRRFYELMADQESPLHRVFYKVFESFPRSSGAVFWECAPITAHFFSENQFEFILMDAPGLAERTVDIEPFSEQFAQNDANKDSVITFPSLGKDALLVVPTPPRNNALTSEFTHLASFMRAAGEPQVSAVWVRVAQEVLQLMNNSPSPRKPLWVSTSGLGVSWLHIRLDSITKYYNWSPYKNKRFVIDD